MTWNESTLGDICDSGQGIIKTGPFGSQLHQSDYSDAGTPVVMPKDIVGGRVSESSIARVAEEHVERLSHHQLYPGDIVYGRRGDIGRCALVTPRESGWLCGTGCLRIHLGNGEVSPKFLFYFLNNPSTVDWIYNQAVGATMPNLNTGILRSIPVRYPARETQERIAAFLSTYDDVIENNTRRIEILEEMARRLYEEWFIHFRFPGHEDVSFKESELGRIPEGWEVAPIGEAVKRFTAGKKYSQKTVSPAGVIPVLDQGKQGIIGYHDDSPGFIASLSDPVIVFANHTCYQRLIFYPFSTIQNVIPFKSSDKYSRNTFWLHHATHGLVELNDYKGHWPQFAAKKIPIADEGLAESFGKLVEPMYHQMLALYRKNANLRAQRDLLLPKLVSGEIDVSDIPMPEDKEVEAA